MGLILSWDGTLVWRRALVLLLLFMEDLGTWVDESWLVTRNDDTRLVWVLAIYLSCRLLWWSQVDVHSTILLHWRCEPILILVILSNLVIWWRIKFLRLCFRFVRLYWRMKVVTVCSSIALPVVIISDLFYILQRLTLLIPLRSWDIVLHVVISCIISVVVALKRLVWWHAGLLVVIKLLLLAVVVHLFLAWFVFVVGTFFIRAIIFAVVIELGCIRIWVTFIITIALIRSLMIWVFLVRLLTIVLMLGAKVTSGWWWYIWHRMWQSVSIWISDMAWTWLVFLRLIITPWWSIAWYLCLSKWICHIGSGLTNWCFVKHTAALVWVLHSTATTVWLIRHRIVESWSIELLSLLMIWCLLLMVL